MYIVSYFIYFYIIFCLDWILPHLPLIFVYILLQTTSLLAFSQSGYNYKVYITTRVGQKTINFFSLGSLKDMFSGTSTKYTKRDPF